MHKDTAFGEYSLSQKSVTAVIAILLLSLSVSLISITAGARPNVSIYLSTDKPYYTYGQNGELYVTVRNEGPGPIEIRKITVTYSWFGWYNGGWNGNETRTDIENNAVAENATSDTFKFTFTVPTEGRGLMAIADTRVNVEYAWGEESADEDGFITIPIETPVTQSPNLTLILYLMGISTVLLILVLIGLFLVWGSLRKLTSAPPATG